MMVRSTLWIVVVTLFSLGLLTSAKSYTPYIIGGETAKVGAWPWMASIRRDNLHFCGGVLIKPSVVLTSGTCAIRINLLNTVVVLGLHNQVDGTIGKPETIKLDSILLHEGLNVPLRKDDLAILKLAHPASNNSFIKPIALPDRDYSIINQVCTFTGWGSSDITGAEEMTDDLQQKKLTVWPDEICRRWWQEIYEQINCGSNPDSIVSAGVCKHDTGGPLSCPGKKGYVLGGISTLWERSCVGTGPAFFTNIPSYVDWINENSA